MQATKQALRVTTMLITFFMMGVSHSLADAWYCSCWDSTLHNARCIARKKMDSEMTEREAYISGLTLGLSVVETCRKWCPPSMTGFSWGYVDERNYNNCSGDKRYNQGSFD